MMVSECPGINPKWLKRMKTWHKGGLKEWYESENPDNQKTLEHFVEQGFVSWGDRPACTYAQWGANKQDLFQYAMLRLFEFELKGTSRDSVFDTESAIRAYAAHYLGTMAELHFDQCNRAGVPRTALGIVLGCGEMAFQLARAVVRDDRRLFWDPKGLSNDFLNSAPIASLMVLLLSDYLQEPPMLPPEKGLEDPILVDLLSHWRSPDPKAIEAACLVICDFHTHGVAFEPDAFVYLPIEILLLFKLRQLLGLENPQLDHPIMNTPLGKLPEETPFQYDDFISQVRRRMIREGFDEMVIFGNDEWCKFRKESFRLMYIYGDRLKYEKGVVSNVDSAIAAETKALAIAEQADPCGLRVFNGLRSLAALHNIKGLKTESAGFYERALAIARQNPDCDAGLIVVDLAALYRDLGRTAEAETLVQPRS